MTKPDAIGLGVVSDSRTVKLFREYLDSSRGNRIAMLSGETVIGEVTSLLDQEAFDNSERGPASSLAGQSAGLGNLEAVFSMQITSPEHQALITKWWQECVSSVRLAEPGLE